MKKENSFINALASLGKRDATKSIVSSVASIIIGLLVGLVIMIFAAIFNEGTSIGDAFYGFGVILGGPLSSGSYFLTTVGDTIFNSVPIILTGLSVAVAFKTGLFNIGAPGQYLMGSMCALLVILLVPSSTRFVGILVWLLAILAGVIAGVLWGMIPGALKALFGINEVIICIMTNWIAAQIVSWVFTDIGSLHNVPDGKTSYLFKPGTTLNFTPTLGLDKVFQGSYIDIGILIAIVCAIAILIIMNKTVLGYQMKACGANRESAKYAGINEKKYIIISMAIAGGLAALGGILYYANANIELQYKSVYQTLPADGFNGIPVALLANCNPIAVIFTAIFIRYISAGGTYLSSAGFNQYFADIIVSVIIYLAGFSRMFGDIIYRIGSWFKKKPKEAQEKGGTK